MARRLRLSANLGLALVLAGIVAPAACVYWHATRVSRNWIPLNMSVSLSADHLRTPEFDIRVKSKYQITIFVEPETDPGRLAVAWSLLSGGRVVAHGGDARAGWYAASFEADEGRYVLDLNLLGDGSRPSARTAHLVIFEIGGEWAADDAIRTWVSLTSLVLFAVGVCLTIQRRRREANPLLTQVAPWEPASGASGPCRFPTAPRRADAQVLGSREAARRWPVSGVPFASLTMVVILFVLLVVFMVLPGRTPKGGLPVHLVRPGIELAGMPGLQPIIVRMQRDLSLYINSQPVSREEFDATLARELRIRPPDWRVYVEGHADLDWGEVVWVVDRIRGHRAEVVLLTRWRGR